MRPDDKEPRTLLESADSVAAMGINVANACLLAAHRRLCTAA